MRSLAVKLTLAFLFVGLLGAVLVAFFVGWRTRQDFDRFVTDQDRYSIVDTLTEYYQVNGSWEGVGGVFARGRFTSPRRVERVSPPVLVDADGQVVHGGDHYPIGAHLPAGTLARGQPIQVGEDVVGWLVLGSAPAAPPPGSPEANFLARFTRAITFGALGATGIALLLGILLARTISRPVQALTAATQRVAQGDLGHQVVVEAQDELGELAGSFNRMSADLARANQIRRQMTADIAHDLRTPLSVILGYTESLHEGKLPPSEDVFGVMHKEALHLRRLVDDLRTLSLVESGELTLLRQAVAPAELLKRTATAHQAAADEKGVALEVRAPVDLPTVYVDPDRMAQVMSNLVTNAMQYTPRGGKITLEAESPDESAAPSSSSVRIHVRDSGTGIAPEDLPYIFNRFYRGDKARPDTGASGLGLAIARSLVELHGGAIAVDSTPGAGTSFTVTLPTSGTGNPKDIP